MQIRLVRQVLIYSLVLNLMRDRAENRTVKALSPNKEELIKWYEEELAPEPWTDGNYHKVFKPGSILEWYNPTDLNVPPGQSDFGHGIYETWVLEDEYNSFPATLPPKGIECVAHKPI